MVRSLPHGCPRMLAANVDGIPADLEPPRPTRQREVRKIRTPESADGQLARRADPHSAGTQADARQSTDHQHSDPSVLTWFSRPPRVRRHRRTTRTRPTRPARVPSSKRTRRLGRPASAPAVTRTPILRTRPARARHVRPRRRLRMPRPARAEARARRELPHLRTDAQVAGWAASSSPSIDMFRSASQSACSSFRRLRGWSSRIVSDRETGSGFCSSSR